LLFVENSKEEIDSFEEPLQVESTELNEDISAITISAWVKPLYDDSLKLTVISKEKSFNLFINNNVAPKETAAFSVFNGIKWITLYSHESVPENEWSHIAVVIENSEISLYLNGQLQETRIISTDYILFQNFQLVDSSNVFVTDSDIVIGASETRDKIINEFSGDLSDVTIYNFAMTIEEITELFSDSVFDNAVETLGISDYKLSHSVIEFNQPVVWNLNVSFESDISNSAFDLPNDAILMSVHVTDSDGETISLNDGTSSKGLKIIDTSTTSNVLKKLKKIDNLVTVNIDGQDLVYSSLDLASEYVDEEGLRKIIAIYDEGKTFSITFVTGVPTIETDESFENKKFSKKVKVYHNSQLHYTDVKTCSDVPEDLVESGAEFRLYWIVDGNIIDVTNDLEFDVSFEDADNNSIYDTICWIVPKLSEQNFVIEADLSIINVQSYPVVGGTWDVKFTTSGTGDLVIRGIDGTIIGDSVPDDLKFLSLYNGTHTLDPIIEENSIRYDDYSSDKEGIFSSEVLTSGEHHLEFTFGSDVEYASNSASSNMVDGLPVSISNNCNTPTVLATLSTGFEDGTHNIIASTQFTRSTTKPSTVDVWIEDTSGNIVSKNEMDILLDTNNHQNSYVLLGQNMGKTDEAYKVKSCGNQKNIVGEAKITAFNDMERTVFADSQKITVPSDTAQSLAKIHTEFPAGDNVLLLSIQVDNGNNPQIIPPESIKILNRFDEVIASNQYRLNLGSEAPTDIQSVFLATTDYSAPPDPTYEVIIDSATELIIAEVKLLALQPADIFFEDGIRKVISGTGTLLASISTEYEVGDDVIVMSAGQFDDEDTGIEIIDVGDYELLENGIPVSINDFALSSQGGADFGSNFAYSLLYRSSISQQNPDYSVNATLSKSAGVVGESKLVSFIPKDAGPPPGPEILSIEAGGTGIGFTDGDTITIEFDGPTNQPTAAEKSDIDSLFTFIQDGGPISMGKNYIGSWNSPTTLVISFIDTQNHQSPTVDSLQIMLNEPSEIKNEDLLSLPSVGISPLLEGDFGTPSGPTITLITASDPEPVTSGFSNNDIITVRFSEDTNTPDPDGDGKLSKTELDSIFDFIQGQSTASLGTDYEGVWLKPRTLIITILDSTGGDPVIGGLKIKSDPASPTPIKNIDENSKPSDSTSPVLEGTWGQELGPEIISFVAEDPDGADAVFGNGDTLTITFDSPTNQVEHSDVYNLFTFFDEENTIISFGTVSSEWIDALTLRLTVTDSSGNNLESAVGSIKAQSLITGNILNEEGNSLPSESISPPLSGDFGQKEGPSIVSVTASGENQGIDADDKLSIKFSEKTNRPSAGTTQEVKDLLKITDLSGNELILGSEYFGKWSSPSLLEIIVQNPSGNNCSTLIGLTCEVDEKLLVQILSTGGLKNEQATSKPSVSISPPISGSFGIKEGPAIVSLTASDPEPVVAGFSEGDTIRIRFSEPTTVPDPTPKDNVLTKADLDSLFFFSHTLSDNYSGQWLNSQTLVITIIDATVDSPPNIGELRVTAKSSGNIQAETGSAASKSTSPPLQGTFGDKVGPSIISVTARDPFGDDAVVDEEDVILIKFSEPTNMAPVNLEETLIDKSQLDALISFTHSIGTNYVGQWLDPTKFEIEITDETGNSIPITDGIVDSDFRLSINEFAELKNEDNTSLNSISESPAVDGTFGSKEGPQIVSFVIGDPNNNPGYGAGDVITILFSESTNKPSVSSKSEIDSVLSFKTDVDGSSINLGTSVSGVWINPYTLKIKIVNADGESMPAESDAIGKVIAQVLESANLKDAAGTSFASTSQSPPLQGTFGLSPGPSIKSLVADDPDSSDSVYSVGDIISMRFSEPTNQKDPSPGDGKLTRNDLDKLFTFTQSIGDDYSGQWIDSMNLKITIDEITLDEPPEINELRAIAKASGDIQTDEGSAASTSTSPVLTGSFGAFDEKISISDGGTATTTMPSGITSSLSLDETTTGTVNMESTELDTTSEETAVFGVLGDTVEITPEGDSPCTTENQCVIEFIFDLVDIEAIDPDMKPEDVRIIHDLDDDGIIETPNENGDSEVLDTTITQLDDNTYLASAIVDHFSKFAVGGVKALALGALASSISQDTPGSSNDPSSPQISKTMINSLGDPSSGFGGSLDPVSLDSVDQKIVLPTKEDLVFTAEIYEDQGINNIQHVEILLDFGGLEISDNDSITQIVYEKDSPLTINDPKQFFSEIDLRILEKDAYNGVLQLLVTFEKPMDTSSIKLVTWDLQNNKSTKTLENVLRIEDKQNTSKEIPKWIKSSAQWWSNNQISDEDFVQGIEFLVKEGIIPVKNTQTTESSDEVPNWIKNTAQWWSDEMISDEEFIRAIEHLIKTGIISVKT